MVSLMVNGQAREAPEGATLADLLEILKISPGMIAVSRNQEIIHREEYPEVILQAGDEVEIVRMVGGG